MTSPGSPGRERPLRCAARSRVMGVSPIGSANAYRGYLLVEWPLPWPTDIGRIPELASLRDLLDPARIRLQAVHSTGTTRRRLILYAASPDNGFNGFARIETDYEDDLGESVRSLLARRRDISASRGNGQAGRDRASDLLICTHGRRDVCCGSLGTELIANLARIPLPDGLTLWRTSHVGGHRFAPNLLALPEGTAWGYADASLAARIVDRRGPLDDVLDRYRGCVGLSDPMVQALEREVLTRVGWELFEQPREGVVLGDGETRLTVETKEGPQTWAARVVIRRRVPVPDCGRDPDETTKMEPELAVQHLRRLG